MLGWKKGKRAAEQGGEGGGEDGRLLLKVLCAYFTVELDFYCDLLFLEIAC